MCFSCTLVCAGAGGNTVAPGRLLVMVDCTNQLFIASNMARADTAASKELLSEQQEIDRRAALPRETSVFLAAGGVVILLAHGIDLLHSHGPNWPALGIRIIWTVMLLGQAVMLRRAGPKPQLAGTAVVVIGSAVLDLAILAATGGSASPLLPFTFVLAIVMALVAYQWPAIGMLGSGMLMVGAWALLSKDHAETEVVISFVNAGGGAIVAGWLLARSLARARNTAELRHNELSQAFRANEKLLEELRESSRKVAEQLAELERSQAERDRLEAQLLHAQRMEAVGTLAAGIAHDMNNVLGAITSLADLMRGELTDPRARNDLEQMITEAERGAKLTRGLLAFSRRGQYRKQVIVAESVVHDASALLQRTLPKSIAIREAIVLGDARVEGDPVHLVQALINFGLNAADAMSDGGSLELSAAVQQLAAGNAFALPAGRYVQINCTDTGTGMDAATKLRVFEPFFTTKPLGRGTGLGLSTVWGIAQAHHGAVHVESELGKGSTFSIYLPTTDAPVAVRAAAASSQAIARNGRILVVDDEPMVRNGTMRILKKLGFEVVPACDGAEGLRMFAERGGAFDLVVLDMRMPIMSGPECFAELRKQSQIPILIATGYAVDTEAQALVSAGAGLIEKPFRAEELIREVTRLLPSRG